ncbi:FHA domain-containing protein [Arthrobacter sp. B3I4]|uniref:FHA domain-containing protein n=1 Tax=Arthrobacter sp. B3I4 TaxID=3042267 RepID=UPI00277E34ED|nr:FHA domain-containing protein [Arthrobacter sp. B3I4]MDQ0757083.1 hypothetical protein [Arthrobacter sp. B3I4]
MAAADRPARVSYTRGDWFGVVRSGTVVLLRPDTDPALLDSLWALLAKAPQIHEVLDAVTAASGGSLARLPWFGIVELRGSLQVLLRGDIDLTVRLAGGKTAELSGRDVSTWTERRFPAAEGFDVDLPDAGPAAGTSSRLPLGEGAVFLRGLHCELAGGESASAGTAAPAAAAADESETAASTAASEAAADDQLLAAAGADIAADLAAEASDHGSSIDTVLDFPEEDAGADAEAPDPEAATPAAAAAEQEPTSSYDHLWEQTVMRNIEDAAVREDPDADEEPVPKPAEEPAEQAADEPAEEPEPAAAGVPAAAATAAAAVPAPGPAVPSGLIDSVPWNIGGGRTAATAGPDPANPAPASAAAAGPAPASLANPPSLSSSLNRPASDDTDHDGQTIMKSALPGPPGKSSAQPATQAPGTGPMVLARVCAQGHANPPTNAQCAYCGEALPGDGVQVRRPRLGRMRLSTGELIDLDQSLIVGRQPSVSRVQGAVMPRLIQVASPGGDISRSHVEIRLEGWHVMLCDLKATNGTVLLREGQAPRRLAQGEMAILFDGDVAELGDGVQLRFEELL